MNKNKLLAVLAEHGDSQRELAEFLGISRVALNRKINSKNASFTQPEIVQIKKRYALSDGQTCEIFFTE